jgi:formate dehydrogenase subunit gamma
MSARRQLTTLLIAGSIALGMLAASPARADEKQPNATPAPQAEDAKAQVQRQQSQPLNNAPVWREVRSGSAGVTQVRGVETGVLVQSQGERWREIRNSWIIFYGGWLLLVVPVAILLFYAWKGPMTTHGTPTGRLIERFTLWERTVHWSTAISFVILALSGIIILFGKYVLLPVFGYTLFSWLTILSKNLHNFVGPLFIFCSLIMFVTFVRDNLWRKHDLLWVKKGGGFLTGEHIASGRFNAGEKAWFWGGVLLLGIFVAASGLVLLFPNFEQGRGTMQWANIIHAIVAVLYMSASLGHIYMGTIGIKGSFDSMKTGYVDEIWAKEHHLYWYDEIKQGKHGPQEEVARPTTAGAQPLH